MRGSARRLRYLRRARVVLKRTCFPSQRRQTGWFESRPSGRSVATCAKHFASRMSVWLAGISRSARRAISSSSEVRAEGLLEVVERAQARLDAAPLLALRAHARLLGAEVGPRS